MAKHFVKIAICDDLKKERDAEKALLSKYMDLHDYVFEVDEFESGEELLAADVHSYDLILLDIFMGGINGVHTAKELLDSKATAKVIFCSTSNEFAAESYEVDALRYLTKPIAEDKMFLTLDRYFQAFTSMQMLTFKCDRMDRSIMMSDVLWIEANRHKCIVHTTEEDILTTTTFSQFWEELQEKDFVKPIRYALVPLSKVTAVPGSELKLIDGTEISIGRDSKQAVKEAYMQYKMKKLLQKGER